jgi:hypothetical protein
MTNLMRIAAVAALSGLMAVGGCTTVRNARDRIVKPQARCANVTVQIYFEADSAGLPAAEFDKTALGQQGATTAAGDTRPLRRRADVTLRLSNP